MLVEDRLASTRPPMWVTSVGCSTSRIQPVSACSRSLPDASASVEWKRLSAVLNPSVPGLWRAASSIAASRRATTASSALTAARPAIGTSSERRASSSSLIEIVWAASISAIDSERLRLMPSLGVRATKIPPERPRPTRIRCAADSSRSASRIVGRLTPNSSASSCSVPIRSPVSSCCSSSQTRICAAICSLAPVAECTT